MARQEGDREPLGGVEADESSSTTWLGPSIVDPPTSCTEESLHGEAYVAWIQLTPASRSGIVIISTIVVVGAAVVVGAIVVAGTAVVAGAIVVAGTAILVGAMVVVVAGAAAALVEFRLSWSTPARRLLPLRQPGRQRCNSQDDGDERPRSH